MTEAQCEIKKKSWVGNPSERRSGTAGSWYVEGMWEASAMERNFDVPVWNVSRKKHSRGRIITSISENHHALTLIPKNTHAPTCDNKTEYITVKSAASLAHTRTVCPLSSCADYFSEKIMTEPENEERDETDEQSTTHTKY